MLRVAVERRYIATNPCDAVKLPRKSKGRAKPKRMLFLNPTEVRALADAMPRPADRLAVYVAAYCGLRAGELWALTRKDIDLLHGTLAVERALKEINTSADQDKGLLVGPTKTHASRSMNLPASCATSRGASGAPSPAGPNGVAVIRDTDDGPEITTSSDPFDPDALVFTTRRATPSATTLVQAHVQADAGRPTRLPCQGRDARTRCGPRPTASPAALPARLHGLRWHDLRHTCASLSLASTGSLHVVKERLGHDDIRTTINIYGHLLGVRGRGLADALDALHAESATTTSWRFERFGRR